MKQKQQDRPVFKKLSIAAILVEFFSFSGLLILLLVLVLNWHLIDPENYLWLNNLLQQEWPIYGNKSTLLILGSVAVFFYVILTVFTIWPQHMYYRVEINHYNASSHYRMMRSMLRWLKLEIVLFVLFLAGIFSLISNNRLDEFNPSNVLVFIFLIIVTIGIYRHRVKQFNVRQKRSKSSL